VKIFISLFFLFFIMLKKISKKIDIFLLRLYWDQYNLSFSPSFGRCDLIMDLIEEKGK